MWALCLAIAASRIHHPLLLALIIATAALVVVARRTNDPWSRSFGLMLKVGLAVILVRTVANVIFGTPSAGRIMVELPSVDLPAWAAGVTIGGPVTDLAVMSAFTEGLRLATVLACVGAANALANSKRLLASLPPALYEVGTAAVIALSLIPSLTSSIQRVRSAHRLRGRDGRGMRSWASVALPVVDDALSRSLTLAAAMDARGYGRNASLTARQRRTSGLLLICGLLGMTVGTVALLNAQLGAVTATSLLTASIVIAVGGLRLAGRRSLRTRYRPDPWQGPEWITVASAVVTVIAIQATAVISPAALQPPLLPVSAWATPLLATGGILAALLPAWLTPPPKVAGRRPSRLTVPSTPVEVTT